MDFLETIIQKKVEEVAAMPQETEKVVAKRPSFYQHVKDQPQKMHLIAEIKRASPSKGDINQGSILSLKRKRMKLQVSAGFPF